MRQTVSNTVVSNPNPFAQQLPTAVIGTDFVQEAVVVDVIVNDEHPEYVASADGYNVGAIKFRMLRSNMFRDNSLLNWAYPIDANVTDYPLIGEVVLIERALNRFYYHKKINTSSRTTAHNFPFLNDEMSPSKAGGAGQADRNQVTAGTPIRQSGEQKSLGKYFIDDQTIFRLRSLEGDILYEGRHGQSIRMGAAYKTSKYFRSTEKNQAPNLLLRVGPSANERQTKGSIYGLVMENINRDLSSIWIVADQQVPLEFSTQSNRTIHAKSIPDFPNLLDKNQIVVNTDRFVVNTKTDKMLFHSSNGIHFTTNKNFTVDSAGDYWSWIDKDRKIEIRGSNTQNIGKDFKFWVGNDYRLDVRGASTWTTAGRFAVNAENIRLVAQKIYLGGDRANERIVLGNQLQSMLVKFLTDLQAAFPKWAMTHVGPAGAGPDVIKAVTKFRIQVQNANKWLSVDNYVAARNSRPERAASRQSLHS
jgi:hypothetical protein